MKHNGHGQRTRTAVFMEKIFFLIFALIAVASAIAVISLKNPVHSAISLMVCFFQVAAIFILLRSPFLAAIQIFLYVGAVMVLFLFVIMMLDIRKAIIERFVPGGLLWIVVILAALIYEIFAMISKSSLSTRSIAATHLDGTVAEIGKALFTEYLLPFEVVSVILLVALVGAIVMGKKEIK